MSQPTAPRNALTTLRIKELMRRLDSVHFTPSATYDEWDKNPEVRKAYAIINRHNEQNRKIRSKERAKWNAQKKKIREAIVFGDVEKALKMLTAFEADSKD